MIPFSARFEYALWGLIELARHNGQQRGLQAREIARKYKIPEKYLVQVLHLLKKHQILSSERGRKGGYRLLVSPRDLTLAQIYEMVESPFNEDECPSVQFPCQEVRDCILKDIFSEAQRRVFEYLETLTLEDLVKKTKASKEYMYYI